VFRSRLDGSDRETVDDLGGCGMPYNMFSISNDQRYIVHCMLQSYNDYFVRIFDKVNSRGVNLPVKSLSLFRILGKLSQEANIIYYISPGYPEELWVRDLDTGEGRKLVAKGMNIVECYMLAPTWDGSRVYFYANIPGR